MHRTKSSFTGSIVAQIGRAEMCEHRTDSNKSSTFSSFQNTGQESFEDVVSGNEVDIDRTKESLGRKFEKALAVDRCCSAIDNDGGNPQLDESRSASIWDHKGFGAFVWYIHP